MQINMPDSGTFFFISDHCHVIENVSAWDSRMWYSIDNFLSGVTVFRKAGWLEIIPPGSRAPSA
jgi:hypothetical protein